MTQLGFVIDHSRCIGCHACTVACKSENDVPLGSFRTWVKYVEHGAFPAVKRHFAVLRCNQCTNAPCMTICPTLALDKRSDGIVDVDPERCIGCKSCMQACPYDALYIHEEKGTAQKCHFCAHRTEIGLAPACAVVCPTEAIVPGDFDDPNSRVSRLREEHDLRARKVEAGTGPNVFYREVDPRGIDPLAAHAGGGYLWSEQLQGELRDAEVFRALEHRAEARTTYNVDHPPLWGGKIVGYLFAKGVAAGAGGIGVLLALWHGSGAGLPTALLLALVALTVTTVCLVTDLKRPERFLYILLKPNWKSWLVKGSYFLLGYGALLTAWLGLALLEIALPPAVAWALGALTIAFAILAAVYTAWLFGQAKGRVLWMKRDLAPHLFAQAVVAGAASLLLVSAFLAVYEPERRATLGILLIVGLAAHAFFLLREHAAAPRGREREYAEVVRLITHGPYARAHKGFGTTVGIGLAIVLTLAGFLVPFLWLPAALAALIGLYVEERVFVRAGQALTIS